MKALAWRYPHSWRAARTAFAPATTSETGRSDISPPTGSGRNAATRSPRTTAMPPPASITVLAASAIAARLVPMVVRLWLSCE